MASVIESSSSESFQTIRSIGEGNWAATCSDSTNVTKASRRELVNVIPTILDLCDAVHHLHNTIGDINKLPDFRFVSSTSRLSVIIFGNDRFSQFMSTLKAIIKYFSKSTIGTAKLKEQGNMAGEDKPVKALQKIGKTRFGTHWTAANALDPCLGNIRHLVVNRIIKFKVGA